ncbi:UTP--glucose-1-phosphate uridylyltransferase [Lachnoclostridium phytofermentans]|uniref:UTP--glucose-1-phosphate uridylyltransferase n=1 Tax=Lachnoclostridium phytofermentans (strain ATCC 700394 / DSM 18823 / ISDg) TaxID=357809 RepID=A9KR04_LACP7|nr:UTP--glucose-1-phosphate uridylyltransferase [Lachnoclostridium phytofermentans]ABX43483.1 UTP--glucose-1-phosphate uridylyltransferase [Lachnoclostridium phytofermentans ISDg]
MNKSDLSLLLKEHNQEHLLSYYDKLSQDDKDNLAAQIEKVDWKLIYCIHKNISKNSVIYEPLEGMSIEQIKSNKDIYYDIGIKTIQTGKVAAVVLAGGQGTRLGCEIPKGMVNIGLTKDVFIFELIFKNIIDTAKAADTWIPLYIMTSKKNNEQTISFLNEHDFFGYPNDFITFYIQDMTPSVDYAGKLLMEAPDQLSLSPNGNGGWFSSMVKANILDDLHNSKIEWINVFSVDNVLQKIADPYFVGATIATNHLSGAKVVRKSNPDERVGVLCLEDGKPSIVEYYEMTDEILNERKDNGELSYAFGVTLNYLFRLDKLEDIMKYDLPIHVVEKKIPYLTVDDKYIEPKEPNGYKFEELVLDMVHLFDNCLPFEVIREKEFAPIKNATGVDSISTAQQLLMKNGYDI